MQALTTRAYVGVRSHPAMGPAPVSGFLTRSPEGERRPVEEVGEGQGLRFRVTFVLLSLTPAQLQQRRLLGTQPRLEAAGGGRGRDM